MVKWVAHNDYDIGSNPIGLIQYDSKGNFGTVLQLCLLAAAGTMHPMRIWWKW